MGISGTTHVLKVKPCLSVKMNMDLSVQVRESLKRHVICPFR